MTPHLPQPDARDPHIDSLANLVCRDLPADWSLELYMERGSGYFTLTDPAGEEVYIPGSADRDSLFDQLLSALAVANCIEEPRRYPCPTHPSIQPPHGLLYEASPQSADSATR